MAAATPSPAGTGVHPIWVLHQQGPLRPHSSQSHTDHVLGFVVEGSLSVECGPVTEAPAGSMSMIPAGVPHRAIGGSGQWWVAGFCAACLRLDEAQLLMRPFSRVRRGAVPLVSIPRSRRRRVSRLFRELAEECERGEPESPELARSLLNLLLGEAYRASPRVEASTTSALASEALAYIQRHAFEGISLRDVAGAVYRTPAHVAAAVKAATGHTVGDWIRSARVSEAASLLAHTDEPLEAIAHRVGWSDKTHFIRQFRRVHGKTPAAWRRQRRQRDE